MQEIKKVLIISDSHGFEDNVRKVIDKVQQFDLIIHCGDFESGLSRIKDMAGCEVIAVPGNNDYGSDLDKDRVVEINNHRIYVTHGHKYGVYYGVQGLYDRAIENNCDVVLFGHTHKPVVKYMGDVTFANPGSISLPRHNFREPTFLTMEFDKDGEIHFTICTL